MNDLSNLFDKDTVESINELIEKKMHLLNQIPEFKEKDIKLANATEKFENSLSEKLNDDFDNIINLHYQIDSYYFTLAYFLGQKHAEQITKL